MRPALLGSLLFAVACASSKPASKVEPPAAPALAEPRLLDLRQLTFGGENAEAYWSFDGQELSFQARREGEGCDRIYRMRVGDPAPKPELVSSGEGATTCAHFFPGDQSLVFASTHLGGKECPPKPDRSQGYVWALYDSYDLFQVKRDGSQLERLTDAPGYDAEATVCAVDGSILFTSVRDGDLELYRMDKDGKNVRRLTSAPGYDGGAFFNRDCTRIVWRASRPKPGKELEAYQALLRQGLVRPSKLELFVADADGSNATQVTYFNAASFAPFFTPDSRRILFSSNLGDPKGREFDLYAINVDGTGLERITTAPGFDGFPMFSPDGKWLAFSSNRATAPGKSDTNIFLARWNDAAKVEPMEGVADRVMRDVRFLADEKREGRGLGTQGLSAAGEYLAARMKDLGLSAVSAEYRHSFSARVGAKPGPHTRLTIAGRPVDAGAFVPLGFSANGEASGALAFVGYGIVEPTLQLDDYRGVDVKGKIAVVRRFVPPALERAAPEVQRRLSDLRFKAWLARERGAQALLVVDWPARPVRTAADWQLPPEAALPELRSEGPGDAGIPVLAVKRQVLQAVWPALTEGKGATPSAALSVDLVFETTQAFNVVGAVEPSLPQAERLPGVVVIGAHYDHLGYGGRDSLAPNVKAPHLGADDNASGTALILELARALTARRAELKRPVWVVAFSGEEAGVLGSSQFVRALPHGVAPADIVAMLNFDMVGRMRDNKLSALGTESAAEWSALVTAACERARVTCNTGGDGFGPSDHTPFYAAGIPVLHFFTGAHGDYHRPSDSAARINAAGIARAAQVAEDVVVQLAQRPERLTFQKVSAPARGDMRGFSASLGTVPDYGGPPGGQKGVLLADVRPGSAADKAGMKRGDILVRLGERAIGGVEDLMFVLNASQPGQTVEAVVLRGGKEVKLTATFGQGRGR